MQRPEEFFLYASGKTQGWCKNKDLVAGHRDSIFTEIQSAKVIHLTNCIMYTKRTCASNL